MKPTLSLEDFYKSTLNWMPDQLKKEIGHFNVFRLDEFTGNNARPIPYNRKAYYKISLIIGPTRIHYADKVLQFKKQGLLFANPQIPYNYESMVDQHSGFFCIFTDSFFHQYGNIKEYPVFKPGGQPAFELNDEQVASLSTVFLRMFDEIQSDYTYKYDVLRNLVMELVHNAQKMEPVNSTLYTNSNASTRISSLFMELLERQFPIETPAQQMQLRHPQEFAEQLAVHVNHLNKVLKEVTGKTTSQLIAGRVMQEARILLKHTNWNISEIAWCLGFEELSHFIHFFKKAEQQTPAHFRG